MKVLVTVLIAALLFVAVPGKWLFKQAAQMADYCTQSVQIVKVDIMNPDNGKYSDESYRLTYSDKTIGLTADAAEVAGEVCRKQERMSTADGNRLGLRRISTYLVSDHNNNQNE